MNNPEIVITIVTVVLTIISTILGLFASKNEKAKKYYQAYIKVEEKIRELCTIAENNYKNGDQKKKYVIANINTFLIENKIDFDIELVTDMIESIIKLTKSINNK